MKKVILFLIAVTSFSIAQYRSEWDGVPKQMRERNSFQRFEWFYRSRLNEKGEFPIDHIAKEKNKEQLQLLKTKGTSSSWTAIGPVGINMSGSFIPYWGVNSGRVRGLDIDPTNPDIAYIGAAAGGIWKTTNGGASWTDVSQGLNLLTFGAIAIDPLNTETVYAGTGEVIYQFNTTTFQGSGLYKTTDGGATWNQVTNVFGSKTHFSDLQVSPHNSNLILASLGSGNWNYSNPGNEGIWLSTDAGSNWSRVISYGDAFDVAFDPVNSSLFYAAIGGQTTNSGFYISTNGGANWSASNTGLPTASTIGRMQFSIAPSNPSIIYAYIYGSAAFSSGHTTVAFKSTDAGANWSQISSGVNIAGSYYGVSVDDQGSYDLTIAVSPSDPNIVMFGNVETSRTTNGSTISFVRNPSGYNSGVGAWAGYTHTDIHQIRFAPSNSSIVYLGCDGGIYKSTNAGATFSHVNNGINTIQFYSVASHPTNPNILYGGAQDNGNFSTSDKGATSWVFESSGDGMNCFVDYNNPNNVFMSTQSGSLMRSTDAGSSWATTLSGIANTAWVAPYWQHPTQPAKIYSAVGQKIYLSTNSGLNWSAITANITTNRLTSVAHSPVNTNNLISVASRYTTSPYVYKSTDAGYTWADITTSLPLSGFAGAMIQNVIADPVNQNTFYIVRASYGVGQVIKTTDFGNTWTSISGNLPAVSANDLFVDPANTNHIYCGNDFGVYWTSDGGTNWVKLSNNMPFVPILDFSFYNYSGIRYLRAATHGRGVYELNIDTPLPVELVSFSGKISNDEVELNWTTSTELNNYGFDIEKSTNGTDFVKVGFVSGAGNSNSPKEYSFIDSKPNEMNYYRLKQIDLDGKTNYTGIVEVNALTLMTFNLEQNYPNPFNPATKIAYTIPVTGDGNSALPVKLKVYNTLGMEVAEVVNAELMPGKYEAVFNAGSLASGIYYYRLTAGKYEITKKMILTK